MYKKKVTVSEFEAEDKNKIYLPSWKNQKESKLI